MDSGEKQARQDRSAALFNNRHFAEVAAQIIAVTRDEGEVITARQIASATGLADSVVRAILLRLTDAVVLDKLPRVGGGRTAQYYQVVSRVSLATIVGLTNSTASPTVARGER